MNDMYWICKGEYDNIVVTQVYLWIFTFSEAYQEETMTMVM